MVPAGILGVFELQREAKSGPLATVVQDLLSILVYFAIATPLAT